MRVYVCKHMLTFGLAQGAGWAGDLDFPSLDTHPQEGEREAAVSPSAQIPIVTDHRGFDTLLVDFLEKHCWTHRWIKFTCYLKSTNLTLSEVMPVALD